MIKALYKFGIFFLGKNFLKGNTFLSYLRYSFRLFIFIFAPFIGIVILNTIETLLKILIGD